MGGGSNNAQKQADQNERDRQAQIKASTGAINNIFDSPDRQAQYDQLGSDTTKFYQNDLDRQNAIAQRKEKFALARSGNTGGSLQADQGATMGQDYLRGVVEASRRGQSAEAGLKGQDETSRMNLIAMAQAGLDTTTAGSQASSALRGNLQSGMANSTANSLGDLFGDFSNSYQKSEDRKAQQQGFLYGYGRGYQPLYGPGAQQSYGAQQPQNYNYGGY